MINRKHWQTLCYLVFGLVSCLPNLGAAAGATLKHIQFYPLPDKQVQLNLQFDKPLSSLPKSFTTKIPPRIVFDFAAVNTALSPKEQRQNADIGVLHQFNVVTAGNRTRLILSLNGDASSSSSRNGNSLSIIVKPINVEALATTRQHFAAFQPQRNQHQIRGVDFHGNQLNGGQIVIQLSDPNVGVDLRKQGRRLLIDFMNTQLPRRYTHNYNVVDFHTPVQNFSLNTDDNNTELGVDISGDYEHFAYQTDNRFIVEIHPVSQQKQAQLQQPNYAGKRISLNFQDIKIRAVLQLLAEFTGRNIVVSDSVIGNITLRLNRVPWDQALDIIMRTRGLSKRQMGTVMLIAPSAEIANQEKQELQEQREVTDLTPIHSELVQINYAKAATLATMLKDKTTSLLSSRGNISVDERTNTLWIQDTADKLEEIRNLVHQLDKPVRQVLIEARVVLVNKDFENDLGIRFGVTNPKHVSGTFNAANQLAGGTAPAAVKDPLSRLNVDLPATLAGVGQVPSFGIALAKLGNDVFLDLELSAIESEGKGEVISSPRLVTANQHEALIESGEEIPYQEATSSGAAAIAFKEAVLRLRVTPQITPDHKIIMTLQVNQDSVSPQDVLGVPIILTKKIETNVLVDNGQTIVLGGIYRQEKSSTAQRVPFLGELPVIGGLFRNTSHVNKQEELLIFITPKIMHAYG